uniref:Ig-like domain-containing protein n=1 Tax=Poecilia formosa TaxID=48698 RepID=A0A087XPW4_POEFO
KLQQPQSSEVKRPGDTVKISCVTSGYKMTQFSINWIRQKSGKGLEWIGWINTNTAVATYASSFQSRFSFTQDAPTMFSVTLMLLLLAAGSGAWSETLRQSASVSVLPGERLQITCQVSYSVSTYGTAWIRQPAGKGLEWIGYMCSGCTGARKDSLKNKFTITVQESSNTVTLNGQNLQPEDSAVYYC